MKILTAIAVIAVFFILGQFRFLSVAGINPNLLLVGLLFFALKTERFRFLGVLLAVSAVLAAVFTPAWFFRFLGLLAVVVVFYFAKNFMTGNRFFDFLVGVILGTLFFYLIINFFGFDLRFVSILKEIAYNLLVGVVVWLVLSKNERKA